MYQKVTRFAAKKKQQRFERKSVQFNIFIGLVRLVLRKASSIS